GTARARARVPRTGSGSGASPGGQCADDYRQTGKPAPRVVAALGEFLTAGETTGRPSSRSRRNCGVSSRGVRSAPRRARRGTVKAAPFSRLLRGLAVGAALSFLAAPHSALGAGGAI